MTNGFYQIELERLKREHGITISKISFLKSKISENHGHLALSLHFNSSLSEKQKKELKDFDDLNAKISETESDLIKIETNLKAVLNAAQSCEKIIRDKENEAFCVRMR